MALNPLLDRHGFTLAELLIVIAIIALLVAAVGTNWKQQTDRAYDVRKKSDLLNIQKAIEEYYNSTGCYPLGDFFSKAVCTSQRDKLQPYLREIPCDPNSGKPYFYEPINDSLGNACGGYRILTRLNVESDPDIERVGCSNNSCGAISGYNYGVASGGNVGR